MAMPMDPRSSMARVFELPELLEIILSYLPALQLLPAQRTSRLWQQLISTSPLLQTMLFLQPDWKLEGRYADDKPGTRPLNNLMLRKIMGGMYPTMTLQQLKFNTWRGFDFARNAANFSIPPASMADGLFALQEEDAQGNPGFWAWSVNVSFPADALLSARERDAAIAYEQASWRKMFISQPPVTALHLTRMWQRSALPVLTAEGGIRMQDLVDGVDQKQSRWNELYIGSDRDWHLEGPIRYSHFLEEEQRGVKRC